MGVSGRGRNKCKGLGRSVLEMLRKLQVFHRVKKGMSRDQVTFKRDKRNKRVGAVGPDLTWHLVWNRKRVGTSQPSPWIPVSRHWSLPFFSPQSGPSMQLRKEPHYPSLGRKILRITAIVEGCIMAPKDVHAPGT